MVTRTEYISIGLFLTSFICFLFNNRSFNGNGSNTGGIFFYVIFYALFISTFGSIIYDLYVDTNEDSNSFLWELVSLIFSICIYALFFFYIPSSLANGGIITKGFGKKTWNPFSNDFFESSGSIKDKLKFGALVLPLTLMNYLFVGIPAFFKSLRKNKYLDPLDYKCLEDLKDINKFYYDHNILKNIFLITLLCLFIPYLLVYITGMTSLFNIIVFCSVGYIMYFMILRKREKDATFFNIYTNGPHGPFDAEKISKNIQKTIDNTIPSLIFPHMKPINLKSKK